MKKLLFIALVLLSNAIFSQTKVQFQNIFSKYDTIATVYEIETVTGNHITAYSERGIQYFVLKYNKKGYGTSFVKEYCKISPDFQLLFICDDNAYYVLHDIDECVIYFALKQRLDNLRQLR